MLKYFGLYLFLFVAVQVQGVPLEDQALTRYDPCHGLGAIYFDKLTGTLWKGTVNLGLYPHFVDAKIEINFKDPIILYGVSQQSKIIVNNERRDIILVPIGKLPLEYYMYLSINSTTTVEKSIVTKFTLNNIEVCDEQNKDNTLTATRSSKNHVRGKRSPYSNNPRLNWDVAILVQETKYDIPYFRCSGVIISPTAVLTAGQCVFYNVTTTSMIATNKLLAQAGTNDLWDLNEIGRQVLPVDRVVINPSYEINFATSDLAILFVNRLVFGLIQPVCVAGPSYNKILLYGQQLVITNYGLTEQNTRPEKLKASYTTVQRDELCIASGYSSCLINEFTLCVGERPNTDAGPQNAGGGLAVAVSETNNKVNWYLHGVLSMCMKPNGMICDPTYLSLFTNVAPHYAWILHHVPDICHRD